MSTLKVSNINNVAASGGGLSIDANGAVSGGLPYPNRNLLYNGAMQVHQRGTSTTGITTSGYFTADRWNLDVSSLGTWTQTIENDAPTGSGLRKSLKMLCTTANAAPVAGAFNFFFQGLEGLDLQRIAKGTSSAQQLTVSFWVKSNVTGTYVVFLQDYDNNRSISASYTVSASATWEKKTITFAADTTGAFDNDNAGSLRIAFALAAGSTYTSGTLATGWGSITLANLVAGQTNLAAATNNYWQITGVQLEVGPSATEFEFKSYGQELRECQRYYVRWNGNGSQLCYIGMGLAQTTSAANAVISLPVEMRVAPTALDGAGIAASDDVSTNFTGGTGSLPGANTHTNKSAYVRYTHTAATMTVYRPMIIGLAAGATNFLGLSAEL